MTNKVNKELLEKALGLLARNIDAAGLPPLHLVVCGGSALIALGLTARDNTRDVDVIALKDSDGKFIASRPLPAELIPEIKTIARDLDLMDNWLNDGPSSIFQIGMPPDFETRLETIEYGSHLTVSYIGRLDQIHLKLFALHDYAGVHHFTDMEALKPSDEEMEMATRWVLRRCYTPEAKRALKDTVRDLGYESILGKI